jgi:hypothetical protein
MGKSYKGKIMPSNGNMVCPYEKAGIKMDYITDQGFKAAVLTAEEKWNTVQDALDCMVTAAYKGCTGVIVPKDWLPEAFFQLKTGFLEKCCKSSPIIA